MKKQPFSTQWLEQVSLPHESLLADSCPSPIPIFFTETARGHITGTGILGFNYAWSSSFGGMGALSGTMRERVTYPGPPPAPFTDNPNNPTLKPVPLSNGGMSDQHKTLNPAKPYVTNTPYVATQYYEYMTNCESQFTVIAGPFYIVREVYLDGGVWKYKASKDGETVIITLPP